MIKVRIARATNNIEQILRFYRDGLGLNVLFQFENHEGFDGIMLGRTGEPYHFEFTKQVGHVVPSAPTKENLIVFYLPEKQTWEQAVQRMTDHGFSPVTSHNLYWDRGGKTFEDFEGYRVVLYHGAWA